jgi:predicted 3-demethylubiquinone-9 3-methyltransferase (glyoxalase superfamily)
MNKTIMQKITPHLWFDNNAEEAAKFYTSIFKNSKIIDIAHYGESAAEVSGRPKETIMTVTFELEGQRFMALNGGPVFKFSPAISFFVNCQTQEEVDDLWDKLSEGGEKEQCGWLKDKFGVSWQIVPNVFLRRDAARQRCQEIGKSHGGNASNEENRHTRLEEGIRRVIVEDLQTFIKPAIYIFNKSDVFWRSRCSRITY